MLSGEFVSVFSRGLCYLFVEEVHRIAFWSMQRSNLILLFRVPYISYLMILSSHVGAPLKLAIIFSLFNAVYLSNWSRIYLETCGITVIAIYLSILYFRLTALLTWQPSLNYHRLCIMLFIMTSHIPTAFHIKRNILYHVSRAVDPCISWELKSAESQHL